MNAAIFKRPLRLLALVVCLVAGAFSNHAFAHSALVGSEPADGSILSASPARLVLRFSEPVSPFVVRLVSPDGKTTSLVEPGASADTVLDLPAPPDLSRGTHALSWRVVSADGHPVGGTVLFSIGERSEAYGGGERQEWPVLGLVWATKVCLYLGLFVGIGGTAYGALVGRLEPGARAVARVALRLGLAATPLALAAQGLDALGSPLSEIHLPSVWLAGWETAFGKTLAIAFLALALALVATRGHRSAKALGILALLGTGAALAASGHASSAPPQWATRPAVFVHGVAVAFWVGALLPLGIALQKGGAGSRDALLRFSRLAPWALGPLVLSGLLLAVVQLQVPSALWTTAYGAVLLVKLVLLSLLFLLAAFNRWSLTAKAANDDAEAKERLVSSIAIECALALVILAVVATWRFTPPPRALVEAAARPAITRLAADDIAAEVAVTPGRIGEVEVSARPVDAKGQALVAQGVSFVLANPTAGIEPITRPAARRDEGDWQAEVLIPVAGKWTLRVEILIDDFTMRRLEGEVEIPPP